ncbi:MAG: hypothetical protein AB7D38_03480 [Sulfurimonas sp.]|uniref:hypothetical protein n=1 Tax=Sulfurimonas sp. TaxID=2022749 RepID=UPI003D12AA2F
MKKAVILLFILVSFSYGYTYNKLLLKAQASIFPKIIMLDKKLDGKLVEGKIIYTIVYEKNDYETALEIEKFIDEKYNGRFNDYAYKINLVEFADLSQETQASAIYSLNSENYIKKVAEIAEQKGVVTFSYDIDNLKNGLLFSLMLEKSTVLYFNKKNLHPNSINFVDSLYRIVKFVESKNDIQKNLYNKTLWFKNQNTAIAGL